MRTNFEGEIQSARHISGGPRGGGGEDSGGDGGGGEGSGLSGVDGRSDNHIGTFLAIFFVSADTCTVGENGGGSGRGRNGGGAGGAGANGGGLGMGGQAKFASRQLIGHEYTRPTISSLVSRPQPPRIQSCPRQSLHLQPA